jgi:hypothetical protein
MVAVVGPSGTGKSSLVQAGLLLEFHQHISMARSDCQRLRLYFLSGIGVYGPFRHFGLSGFRLRGPTLIRRYLNLTRQRAACRRALRYSEPVFGESFLEEFQKAKAGGLWLPQCAVDIRLVQETPCDRGTLPNMPGWLRPGCGVVNNLPPSAATCLLNLQSLCCSPVFRCSQ